MSTKIDKKVKDLTIGIEVFEGFIKVIAGYLSKSGPVLVQAKKFAFDPESKEMPKALKEFFRSHSSPKSNFILNISRSLSMARFLRLPSVDDKEIKSMVEIESQKQHPYRDEAVITGYSLIDKTDSGYCDVFLAITQESYIKNILSSLKAAGINITKAAYGPESLISWYLFIKDKSSLVQEARFALLNADSGSINMVVLEQGRLRSSRAFNYQSEKIIDEIKKTIAGFQSEQDLKIDRIILSGAGSRVEKLKRLLNSQSEFKTRIVPQDYFCDCSRISAGELDESSFVELLGVIFGSNNKIDLLPKDLRRRRYQSALRKNILKSLALFLCILGVFSGLILKKAFDKKARLRYLDSKIIALAPKVKEIKRMRSDLRIIKSQLAMKSPAVDTLREIYQITPQGVKLDLMEYERAKSLTVRGSALSLALVVEFTSLLESSDDFKDVKLKYTSTRRRDNEQFIDFEIMCRLL